MTAHHAMPRTAGTAPRAGAPARLAVDGAPGGSARVDASARTAAAEKVPGYAIEDCGHPKTEEIPAKRDITLKRCDGRIPTADRAGTPDLREIRSRTPDGESADPRSHDVTLMEIRPGT
ncbi:hypothetical protein SLA_0428 [Streptomyces laurentii]|uniref:Uncharacterized protein n=1 Tax=Streptomyces laurentii TaxID=39478 RepID=A0A160NUV9_STRLU|nr:hypothetical protein SLA_0428 [Streptomyces laurentii]